MQKKVQEWDAANSGKSMFLEYDLMQGAVAGISDEDAAKQAADLKEKQEADANVQITENSFLNNLIDSPSQVEKRQRRKIRKAPGVQQHNLIQESIKNRTQEQPIHELKKDEIDSLRRAKIEGQERRHKKKVQRNLKCEI